MVMQYSSFCCNIRIIFEWGEVRHKSQLDSAAGLRALCGRGSCLPHDKAVTALLRTPGHCCAGYARLYYNHTRRRNILQLRSLFSRMVASAVALVDIQWISLSVKTKCQAQEIYL